MYNRSRGIFLKEPTLGNELGDSEFYYIEADDLIFSGQFAWEGAVGFAGNDEDGCIAYYRYPILTGKEGVSNTAYLWAYFTTEYGDFLLNEHSRGSAGRNRPLNMNTLRKETIPIPPIEKQLELSKLVYHERKLKEMIKEPIKLLKERRTALISSAVTGKIDVRDWKPPKK